MDAVQLHDPITVWCAIRIPPVPDDVFHLPNGWVASRRIFQVER